MSSAKRPTRREFLVATSTAAIAAATPVNSLSARHAPPDETASSEPRVGGISQDLFATGPQRTFAADRITQVAMPIGGMGAGSVCLNGYGGLQDFSIRTRPETSGLPVGFTSNSPEAGFAILHLKGASPVTRLVEGPFPPFKIFDQGLQGQGLRRGGFEGFPRFTTCTFRGEYPFGEAQLSDAVIPVDVTVTGWNPVIPLDDKNSGIPCAILEYRLQNKASAPVDYQFTYHLSHLAPGCKPEQASSLNEVIPGKGVYLSNAEAPNSEGFGSASLIARTSSSRRRAGRRGSPRTRAGAACSGAPIRRSRASPRRGRRRRRAEGGDPRA